MDADEPISFLSRPESERTDVWLLSYLPRCSLHDAPLPQNPPTLYVSGAAHHASDFKLAWPEKRQLRAAVPRFCRLFFFIAEALNALS